MEWKIKMPSIFVRNLLGKTFCVLIFPLYLHLSCDYFLTFRVVFIHSTKLSTTWFQKQRDFAIFKCLHYIIRFELALEIPKIHSKSHQKLPYLIYVAFLWWSKIESHDGKRRPKKHKWPKNKPKQANFLCKLIFRSFSLHPWPTSHTNRQTQEKKEGHSTQ